VNDIVWLTMRRMRTPLILMILMFCVSVLGMVLIPGQDANGNPYEMGYLDAAYFVTILATTIGFGEVPYAFTGAQRLWVFIIIFPNVIVWLYSIGTILSLFLDHQFRAVLQRSNFARRVHWISRPFFVVCGFGNTGSSIVQSLLSRGYSAVVVEREQETVHRMMLNDSFARVPALSGDVTDHRLLDLAGLDRPLCQGLIVTTNDDHVNLTVAITGKLLKKNLPVLARSETRRVSENMASFGTDLIVDPYAIFAERVFLALSSPVKFLVQDWLLSVYGTQLREPLDPPVGRWIVCGAGRFGSRITEMLQKHGLPFTVVDVIPDRIAPYDNAILGRGTAADTLIKADVDTAAGIFAGTGDDVDNLSIIMTALELNPKLFVIARQEKKANDPLFEASGVHLVAQRSQIVARRILSVATTPLTQTFLQYLIRQNDDFAERVAHSLKEVLAGLSPRIWVVELEGEFAEGLRFAKHEGIRVQLSHLTEKTRSGNTTSLGCVCLVLQRGAHTVFLPEPDHALMDGDQLLFAGRNNARREMLWTLADPNSLISRASGRQLPRGWIWRWLWRRRQRSQTNSPDKNADS
jgi:Trk K+ transport system NAD-binding subunit